MTLMFAYGSNLNLKQMKLRCPKAIPLGAQRLAGRKLVFRGVADCPVVADEKAVCYGGVWKITPECERLLDLYEGVERGMYRKEYIPIREMPDGEDRLMLYVMNSTGIMPPSEFYLNVIRQGYRDFHLSKRAHKALDHAVGEAWDDKAPSHVERQRHRRTGRPLLAKRPPAMAATGREITPPYKRS